MTEEPMNDADLLALIGRARAAPQDWLGRLCRDCKGSGETESAHGRLACNGCGGTGEAYGYTGTIEVAPDAILNFVARDEKHVEEIARLRAALDHIVLDDFTYPPGQKVKAIREMALAALHGPAPKKKKDPT